MQGDCYHSADVAGRSDEDPTAGSSTQARVIGGRVRSIPIMILLIGVLGLLTACSGRSDSDADETATARAQLSPREYLDQAIDRWNETEGARFSLEIEGETYLDEERSVRLLAAEGELSRPASVRADASIRASVVRLNISLIFIGDRAYMTDILTGQWGPAPEDFSYDPSVLLDNDEGLSAAIDAVIDPQFVAAEGSDDDKRIISGSVPRDAIEVMTAGALDGEFIDVSVTIDPETFNLLAIRLAEEGESGNQPTVWIITISDHGEEFTIDEPEVS